MQGTCHLGNGDRDSTLGGKILILLQHESAIKMINGDYRRRIIQQDYTISTQMVGNGMSLRSRRLMDILIVIVIDV